MRNSVFTIKRNQKIASEMYEMLLQIPRRQEDEAELAQLRPGQFVNLKIEGCYLRRPISVCDWDAKEGTITLIYQTVGQGTGIMSRMQAGERIDVLWTLGNGYDLTPWEAQEQTPEQTPEQTVDPGMPKPLLIAGGAGVPPMVGLCRQLKQRGADPVVILGFRTSEQVICREHFEKMGARVIVTTEDGSMGQQGFVTDAAVHLLKEAEVQTCAEPMWSIFACGPEAMLRTVDQVLPEELPGQMSFE